MAAALQLVLNAALNVKGVAALPTVKAQSDPVGWLAAHVRAAIAPLLPLRRDGQIGDEGGELFIKEKLPAGLLQ